NCLNVLLAAILLLGSQKAYTQEQELDSSKKAQYTYKTAMMDTFVMKKKFWRSSSLLLVTELIPWSYNYFIRKADFAKVTFESIGYNLKFSNWEWDDNSFKTNQFAHPYHGSVYFNSFR